MERFGNTHHVVLFVVSEQLAVDMIIKTAFLNKNVIDFMIREQRIKFGR